MHAVGVVCSLRSTSARERQALGRVTALLSAPSPIELDLKLMSGESDWLRLHDVTANALEVLASEVREADKLRGGLSVRDKMKANKKLDDAKREVSRLSRALEKIAEDPLKYRIGEGELNRRRGLIDKLTYSIQSTEGLVEGSGAKRSRRLEETDETKHMSSHDIHQSQAQARRNQDDQLDQILTGVGKLKDMSHDIHRELDLQTHLLSDLDTAVERTDRRMVVATDRVDDVNRKSSGSCGILCIFLWLIILIFLATSNVGCHIFKPSAC